MVTMSKTLIHSENIYRDDLYPQHLSEASNSYIYTLDHVIREKDLEVIEVERFVEGV